MKLGIQILLSTCFSLSVVAQGPNGDSYKKSALTENELKRWSHLDLENDSIPGMSIDRIYTELLKGKKGTTIIVGVIDSGVDIDHEDIKSKVWTNTKEIPNNGIDDDKNGYIDDVHGWNFLGETTNETLEMTRMVKKGDDGSPEYQLAKAEYDKKYQKMLENKNQVDALYQANTIISEVLKKEDFTIEDVKNISSTDEEVLKSKAALEKVGVAGPKLLNNMAKFKDFVYDQLNHNLNPEFNARQIVGDNPNDINDTNYGNNVVYGPDKNEALHGTHVAGIIGQVRNNNVGGDGISDNVAIMSVRAVPNGDEYDKDIALAIRYAVDNGAKVINASFGKNYSPNKQWVYDAIKYAESKDVLIIHAAGNDSKDIDVEPNFPNDSDDKITEFADNVITVGALNFEYGSKLVANFSNYGKNNVDVYAPGVKIYATTPNNEYQYLQGTSMASPNVAGVAAMIRSYYPNLSAKQVKEVIMESGTTLNTEVVVGGNPKDKRPFDALSKSGKIVNGYKAMELAKKRSEKSKKKSKNRTLKG